MDEQVSTDSTRSSVDISYLQRHISKADTDDSSSLGNVAGSNLDPVSKLSKWSCSHCRQMFTPSATIYSDPDDHGSRYCQGCYRRKFQKGTCCRCYKGVFPDQKYIHMDRYYWHKVGTKISPKASTNPRPASNASDASRTSQRIRS